MTYGEDVYQMRKNIVLINGEFEAKSKIQKMSKEKALKYYTKKLNENWADYTIYDLREKTKREIEKTIKSEKLQSKIFALCDFVINETERILRVDNNQKSS